MWNLKKNKLIETEGRLVVARDGGVGWAEEMREGGQGYKLPVTR